MKVSTVQRDISLKQGSLMPQKKSSEFREKSTGANKDENRGYSANYGGSFTGKSETAANAMKKGGILASGWFNSLTIYAKKHNIGTSALIALGLAGILRPATIMALPGKKDKEDKIYASGQSMASAILGFIVSIIVTSPLDSAIEKVFKGNGYLIDKNENIVKGKDGKPVVLSKKLVELFEKEKSLEEAATARDKVTQKIKDKAARKAWKGVQRLRSALEIQAKNIPDLFISIPRATLTIALIPPILKYVFGLEKKKKQENKDVNTTSTPMNFINKPVFKQLKSGASEKSGNQPNFTGKANLAKEAEDAAKAVANTSKGNSSIFKPLDNLLDKCSDFIAKHFTGKLVDSKPMNYLANKFKDSSNLYQHCITAGSLVTSGLYMEKTLTNDKLDKDRKKTLAVNQGLTFILSTIGAYTLDKYLKNWWENVTAKFVGNQVELEKFSENFKNINKAIDQINKKLKENPGTDVNKIAEQVKESMKMPKAGEKGYAGYTDYLEHAVTGAIEDAGDVVKSVERLKLDKYISKLTDKESKLMPALSEELATKIKGMGLLRSMLVFSFIYRFFVPVVVTKPANWLCDKYLSHKKAKNAENTQKAA